MTTNHKSGQATIVLIVVTMVTVLGVAVASSSQSRINLRDTVYSTQSLQAISCAEAGGDRALASDAVQDEAAVDFGTYSHTLSSTDSGYSVSGCDGYTVDLLPYPEEQGDAVTIPSVPENTVQQFTTNQFTGSHRINFIANNSEEDSALAVYQYYQDKVKRFMLFCDPDGSGAPLGVDFDVELGASHNITLEDGTTLDVCSYNMDFSDSNQVVLRVRPIYSSVFLQVENFQNPTGFKIASTGTSGQVERKIDILKFFSQLPGYFDEAVVSNASITN